MLQCNTQWMSAAIRLKREFCYNQDIISAKSLLHCKTSGMSAVSPSKRTNCYNTQYNTTETRFTMSTAKPHLLHSKQTLITLQQSTNVCGKTMNHTILFHTMAVFSQNHFLGIPKTRNHCCQSEFQRTRLLGASKWVPTSASQH